MRITSTPRMAPYAAGPETCPERGVDPAGFGFSDVTGRQQVATTQSAVSVIVLLVIGQSNAINIAADTSFIPVDGVDNFNFYDGKTYVARDPLLGPETTDLITPGNPGACFATKLGSMMVETAMADRVIIANMAIGGTALARWLPGGELEYRPRFVIRSMLQAGIAPDFVLQVQGESDNINGTSAATYADRQRELVAEFRRNGCEAPYFVAQTSSIPPFSNNAAVRAGQAASWSDELGIYAGPDTDSLGLGYRAADQTHFTAAGNTAHASLWLEVLQDWIAAH